MESKLDFVSSRVREFKASVSEESSEGIDLSPLKTIQTVERARSCIAALFEMVMNLRVEKLELEDRILEFDANLNELERHSKKLTEGKKQQEKYFQSQVETYKSQYEIAKTKLEQKIANQQIVEPKGPRNQMSTLDQMRAERKQKSNKEVSKPGAASTNNL